MTQKNKIMKYTYGQPVPIINNPYPEVKATGYLTNQQYQYKEAIVFKLSKWDKLKFGFERLIKQFPFKILSLFHNKVSIAQKVLLDLELLGQFKFSSYSWIDLMGGTGVWTKAIENISSQKVFTIDIQTDDELRADGLKIYSNNRITGNILDLKIDKSINAIFIRSGLKVGVLEEFLNNNPHIKTLVYCEIKYSINGSVGIEKLFNSHNQVSVKRFRSFELGSVSNLKFNSEAYSYDFHIFTR